MSNVKNLITEHIDTWTSAIKTKYSSGRGSSNKRELYGIKKLRELIFELAVRGLLTPRISGDDSVKEILQKNIATRNELIKAKEIKKQKKLPSITEDEIPYTLPENWVWARLGDLTNYGISDKAEALDVGPDTWVLELEDVEKETSKLLQIKRFSERQFKSSKNRFKAGDVIYGKLRPYLDKVIVAEEDGVCTTEMIPIRAFADIVPEYLRIVLKSPFFKDYANNSTHGMNLPRMGTDKARLAIIPICSLKEQESIADKVHELLELCNILEQETDANINAHEVLVSTLLNALTDAAASSENGAEQFQQAWERIAQNFDILFTTENSVEELKQAILQLAVMGKLVPQDPNDEPASLLLEKIAAAKEQLIKDKKINRQKPLPQISDDEKPFELPYGWAWCRLQDSIDVRDGTHDSPKDSNDSNSYPLITSKNFINGKIDFERARKISEKDHLEISKRSLVEVDDILFSMIGGNIGNQVIVKDPRPFSIKNVALFKYYDKKATDPTYFKIFTEELALELQTEASGGAQPFVSLGSLRKLVFALPPYNEQLKIVEKVKELFSICNKLSSALKHCDSIQIDLADIFARKANK